VPLAKVFIAAASTAPVGSLVPDECPNALLQVKQLQDRLLAKDAEVFKRIQQQFKRNAGHWPTRLDSPKHPTQLMIDCRHSSYPWVNGCWNLYLGQLLPCSRCVVPTW